MLLIKPFGQENVKSIKHIYYIMWV